MTLSIRHTGPRVIQHNADNALPLDVYNHDTQAQQTATAGTVSIWIGSKQIVTDAAVTTLGPPASYTLPAASTVDEVLSGRVREVWSLTIAGAVEKFTIGGYLVLYPFRPPITEQELLRRHRGLAKLMHPDDTTFAPALEKARQWVETVLLRRGRRPWQLVDSWALAEAFELRALHHIYADAVQSAGSGEWRRQADQYRRDANEEIALVNFRTDVDEDGFVDSEDQEASAGPLVLTSGRINARFLNRRFS